MSQKKSYFKTIFLSQMYLLAFLASAKVFRLFGCLHFVISLIRLVGAWGFKLKIDICVRKPKCLDSNGSPWFVLNLQKLNLKWDTIFIIESRRHVVLKLNDTQWLLYVPPLPVRMSTKLARLFNYLLVCSKHPWIKKII